MERSLSHGELTVLASKISVNRVMAAVGSVDASFIFTINFIIACLYLMWISKCIAKCIFFFFHKFRV